MNDQENPFGKPIFGCWGAEDEIDEDAHGVAYIGGFAAVRGDYDLATSYFAAADMLIEDSIWNEASWKVVLPALFLVRNGIELRLKAIVQPDKLNHDLVSLTRELAQRAEGFGIQDLSPDLVDRIGEFQRVDPRADAFRFTYAMPKKDKKPSPHFPWEVLVNLGYLRSVAQWIDAQLVAIGKNINQRSTQ